MTFKSRESWREEEEENPINECRVEKQNYVLKAIKFVFASSQKITEENI